MKCLRLVSEMDSIAINRLLDGNSIAFSASSVASLQELELAYHLAQKSLLKKRNIAKKLKYEFLLWLTGKKDITSAFRATSFGRGADFLLIIFSGRKNRTLLTSLSAKKKSLSLRKNATSLELEMISLSRV